METFDTCPFCGGREWQDHIIRSKDEPDYLEYKECVLCKARYNNDPAFGTEGLTLPEFLGEAHKHLHWDIAKHLCSYGSLKDRVRETETILPWLDFDITPKQLKLYLTFL